MRFSFMLGAAELRHFEEVAQQTQTVARTVPPDAIVAAAQRAHEHASQAHVADFVKERFSRLKSILDMLNDADWQLPDEDRQRVINALAYFSTPSGGVDGQAALGSFDQAIMIELASRDLEFDLSAYREFCRYRQSLATSRRRAPHAGSAAALQERRQLLQQRMHRRRELAIGKVGSPMRKVLALFGW